MTDDDISIDKIKEHISKIKNRGKKQQFAKPHDTTFAWLAANGTSPFRVGSNLVFTEAGLGSAITFSLGAPASGSTETLLGATSTNTLTNKTINASQNTLSGVQQSPTIRRFGEMQPVVTAAAAGSVGMDGAMALHTHVSAGGALSQAWDTTYGLYNVYTSGAGGNANAGVQTNTGAIGIARAAFATRIRATVKAGGTTTYRMFIGFTSNTTFPTSDTLLATTDHGAVVGYRAADSVWNVFTNNGGGSAMTVTPCTGTTTTDTNWHVIDMSWPAGGTPLSVIIDGNAQAGITTALPATANNLLFSCVGQTSGAGSIVLNIKGVSFESAG